MKHVLHTLHSRIFKARIGQALPEYGLILALITLACIGAVTYFGQSFSDFFQVTGNYILNVASRF